jgi:ferredoxin
MSRPNWTLSFIRKAFIKDMKKMRATRLPGLGRAVEKLFFEGDHLICLPPDRSVTINRPLDEPEQTVLPSSLAEHFLEKTQDIYLMKFCICRLSAQCKDYPVEYGCLFIGEPARDINPEWAEKITAQQAKEHLAACREKGLVHFIGKSKLDTVWLGISPGEKLLTICNCCPCCCITRGIPYVAERLAKKIHRAPGVSVTVGNDCLGCGACTQGVCFANAISLEDGQAVISQECRGCGRCVDACPNSAITLSVDMDFFMSQSLDDISRVVNL